jgi:hypothetical protein
MAKKMADEIKLLRPELRRLQLSGKQNRGADVLTVIRAEGN